MRKALLKSGIMMFLFLAISSNCLGQNQWVSIGPESTSITALAFDPQSSDTLYAGSSNAGVFKSTDGGASWTAVNNGLTCTQGTDGITALAINPQTPDTLYAGTANCVLFTSTNGGSNWSAVTGLVSAYPGEDDPVTVIAFDPQTPNTLYAGLNLSGLFKSTNGGITWAALPIQPPGFIGPLRELTALAINPQTPDTLYVGYLGNGVLKSTDGGATWTAVNNGLTNTWVTALAINPQTPDTLYAGTEMGLQAEQGCGVFESTDGGANWTEIDSGLPNCTGIWSVSGLAINPQTPNILDVADDVSLQSSIFQSANGGASWTAINNGLPTLPNGLVVNTLAINPQISDTLYAGTTAGLYKYEGESQTSTCVNIADDGDTLLLLPFDGTLEGANGQTPVQDSGYSFQPGVSGSGLYLPDGNQLYYASSGNINALNGTVELWINPDWNGNDGQGHTLLSWGGSGGILIEKDGANNLRIILNQFGGSGNPEVGTAANISGWIAGEWHYVAFGWTSNKSISLYIDGVLSSSSTLNFSLPAISASSFQLGADGTGNYLDATIDELRISDIERSAAEISQDFSGGLSISPTSANVGSGAGAGSVSVTALSGCNWTATSNASWITITSGISGTANGTVSYSASANPGPNSRTGTITIGYLTFTVTQAAPSASVVNISVTPGSLNFGNVNVGQSATLTITITNEASSTAALTGSVTGPMQSRCPTCTPGPFSVVSGDGAFNLSPGHTLTVTVQFSPTAAGTVSASLSITHNATNQSSPVTVALSGTGINANAPTISVTPMSYDYGSVGENYSKSASFTVTNSGNINLIITSTSISGTDPSMFKVSGGGRKTIKPGSSLTIKVTFKPTSVGEQTATLVITSNDPITSTCSIALSGKCIGGVVYK